MNQASLVTHHQVQQFYNHPSQAYRKQSQKSIQPYRDGIRILDTSPRNIQQIKNQVSSKNQLRIIEGQQSIKYSSNSQTKQNLTESIRPNDAQNIYRLMKEQAEMAIKGFKQKFGQVLKKQAQQIQRLNSIVVQNNKMITMQSNTINKLSEDRDESVLAASKLSYFENDRSRLTSKSPSKLSLTKKTKMTLVTKQVSPSKTFTKKESNKTINFCQISTKIDELSQKLQIVQQKQMKQRHLLAEIQKKLGLIESTLVQNCFTKLNICQKSLESFLAQSTKKIQNQNKALTDLAQKSAREINKLQNNQNLTIFVEQISELKEALTNLEQRQFKYDSFQLEQLNLQIQKVKTKLLLLERAKGVEHSKKLSRENQSKIQQKQHQLQKNPHKNESGLNYSQKITSNKRSSELDNSQVSYVSHYSPAKDDNKKNTQNNLNLKKNASMSYYQKFQQKEELSDLSKFDDYDESFNSDEDDQFFYPEVKSQVMVNNSMHFRGENSYQEHRSSNIDRFMNLMRTKNIKLPVKIEIDQTGYAKYSDKGMYIIDNESEGFEFNECEMGILKKKGIIFY